VTPRRDTGSTTAEFAVLLPAVVMLLALGLSLVSIQAQSVGLAQQVGQFARQLEAGQDVAAVKLNAASFGVRLRFSEVGGLTCISGSRLVRIVGFATLPIESNRCALVPGN